MHEFRIFIKRESLIKKGIGEDSVPTSANALLNTFLPEHFIAGRDYHSFMEGEKDYKKGVEKYSTDPAYVDISPSQP